MIQDIAPHKYDNTYREQAMKKGDFAFYVEEDKALLFAGKEAPDEKEQYRIPLAEEIEEVFGRAEVKAQYLFSIDEKAYFLITDVGAENGHGEEIIRAVKEKTGREPAFFGTQYFRTMKTMYQAFAAVTALQLWRFRESRKFCGRCGTRTEHSKTERAYVCPKCGQVEYPKISPAIIVAITNGDKLLMSRYRGRSYGGYALIAGFVEIGETFEETVHREVMEEVGLKVKNIRYIKSQPWAFTDSEMIGFFAELDGDDTIKLQEDELSEAAWYSRAEIPDDNSGISVAGDLKMAFKYETL